MPRRSRTTHLVFHTAAAAGDPSAATIDGWHRQRGWSGIGYHYVIRKNGEVETGRREDFVGAHCRDGGMNPRSVGVCFSGHHGDDFHGVTGEPWTDAQERSWLDLATRLMDTYDIPVANVIGHVEAGAAKACPGDRVDCDAVRARLTAEVQGVPPETVEPLAAIKLSGSVGDGGKNRDADVRAVQAGLKEAARLTLDDRLDPGPVDGRSGDGTEGAIARMQRRMGVRRPDARIDPDGTTLRRLNALRGVGRVHIHYPFATRSAWAFHGAEGGMRAFAARRGRTRAHAGIDLYMPDDTPVLALADGTVSREPYAFYRQTWAVDVDHGAFTARYCEIAKPDSGALREGEEVSQGQKLGRVGVLRNTDGTRWTGVPSMMLHLEMYDNTESGIMRRAKGTSARSEHGVLFYRRKDLIDPTGFIHRAPLPA